MEFCLETSPFSSGKIGVRKLCTVSTMHDPIKETKILRTKKNGTRQNVTCPVSISDYNKYMGGVDNLDHLLLHIIFHGRAEDVG